MTKANRFWVYEYDFGGYKAVLCSRCANRGPYAGGGKRNGKMEQSCTDCGQRSGGR